MTAAECLFCRIAQGEARASLVHEDGRILAFADPFPASHGHLLVIPRDHYEAAYELPEDLGAALFRVALRLAQRVKHRLEPNGLYLLQASEPGGRQRILHFHLHLIPRYHGDGLQYDPPRGQPTGAELDHLASLLREL